jgi:hypothetical protein
MIAVALVARVACMVILQSWEFEDDWHYGFEMGRIGKWLAEGQGFTLTGETPTAKFPPLYPFVVAGAFSVFGIFSTAAAISLFLSQSLYAAVSAVCLFILGSHYFGRTTGLLAGFAWALYPSSVFQSIFRIWYTELSVMLLLVTVVVAVTAKPPFSLRQIAYLGGLSGLVILTDSTMFVYLLLLFAWVLLIQKAKLSKLAVMIVVWGMAAGVVVSPWMFRNQFVLGAPYLLKSNFGLELFRGNNAFSSGENVPAELAQAYAALDQEERTYYESQTEAIYYAYLKGKALEWIQGHPVEFLQLTARRFFSFWVMIAKRGWMSLLHFAYFGPCVVLALFGLWYSRRRWWHLAPVWLFLLVYPLPYYLLHVSNGRYSYPVEPFVILLMAVTLTVWLRRISSPARLDRVWHWAHLPSRSCPDSPTS